MVAWYWLIAAFLGGGVLVAITECAVEWENLVMEFFCGVGYVVLFIPLMFYNIFIKNVFPPIPLERWDKLSKDEKFLNGLKYKELFKNFYIGWEWHATKLWNKIFFFRISEKAIDK